MSEQDLKVFNSLKKIFLWSLFYGIFFVLSGCGDFVEETDTDTCNKAIDERDYDTALSACTSSMALLHVSVSVSSTKSPHPLSTKKIP
jgi:hypothetical protein